MGAGSTTAPGQYPNDGAQVRPVQHCTDCTFDAYAHYNEMRSSCRRGGLGGLAGTFRQRHLSCDSGACGTGCTGDPNGYCDQFPYSNAHPWLDFEKRFFVSYVSGSAKNLDSRVVYGNANSLQVGAEFLPTPITDADLYYCRWGITAMFNYSRYEGDASTTLLSELSGSVIAVDEGQSYGFVIGPTFRTDFEIHGLRLSPNATFGVAFDWTTLDTTAPTSASTFSVEEFKTSGFDAGPYVRLMLDVALSDNVYLGIGGDYKHIPTDVMVSNDGYRGHLGFVITLSHEF